MNLLTALVAAPHQWPRGPRGLITLSLSLCSPPSRDYGGGITAGDSNGRDCLKGKVKAQCRNSLPPARPPALRAVGFRSTALQLRTSLCVNVFRYGARARARGPARTRVSLINPASAPGRPYP